MKIKSFALVLFLFCLACFSSTAAQAQAGIYSEFNATDIHSAGEPWMYGVTLGAYFDMHISQHLPHVTIGPDFRLLMESGSNSAYNGGPAQSVLAVSGGVRLAAQLMHQRLHPYVEGLIGVADSQIGELVPDNDPVPPAILTGPSQNQSQGAALDSQGVAGIDLRLTRHLEWRVVEFEYSNLHASNGVTSLGLTTLSSGFVVVLR